MKGTIKIKCKVVEQQIKYKEMIIKMKYVKKGRKLNVDVYMLNMGSEVSLKKFKNV